MPFLQSCFCVPKDCSHYDDDTSFIGEEAVKSDDASFVGKEAVKPLDATVVPASGKLKDTPPFQNTQFLFPHQVDHHKLSRYKTEKKLPSTSSHRANASFITFVSGFLLYSFAINNKSESRLKYIHDIATSFIPNITVIQLLLLAPFLFNLRKYLMTVNKTQVDHSNLDVYFETNSSIETESETSSSDGSVVSTVGLSYKAKIIGSNIDIKEAFRNLPEPSTWKYSTIFIQPAGETRCPGLKPNQSVPIGVPVEFESDLFKGRILFRFRSGKTEDEQSHNAYFNSSQYKVQRQIVIQGQFKERLKMSEMYMGDIFDRKWSLSPPPSVGRMVNKIFTRLAPGLVIDVATEKPKVMVLIGGGSHTISIDRPGDEPDMTAPDIPENTFMSNDIKSSEMRKKVLGNPAKASKFEFDPDMVYTFHSFDEVLDIANYQFNIPFLNVDIANVLGGQPISIRAVNRPETSSQSFFYFRCWHEKTIAKTKEGH
mmetsp:Transcript_12390/g.19058  ORF Transcript_12390/g.19058 Transcript_12390/m.19058 type:complete len:484 (+) Transcript_12390:33-1484(+)